MKKQIYGLIKYNYEINKKRNIFFKYYDFYPNRLNQKEMGSEDERSNYLNSI